ncbi:MAG: hypothetical protein LBE08_06110 [Bifidobacteriaceae bacterium]|jgi:hypothetical protein|nr:hypothetical protein [Bifidobacteriaceae bacterium]
MEQFGNLGMTVALVIFGIGVLFLALAGIWFRVRAVANRPAWGGGTVPLAVIGLIFVIPGLILVYLNYK